MVRLKRDYTCAPEGHTVVLFKAGTEVDGQVAQWALADGAAEVEKPETPKANKKKRGKKKATRKPDEIKPAAPDEDKD